MIAFENELKIGRGIYSVPDLAFILGLPQHRVRRWLHDFYDQRLGGKYKGKYTRGTGREMTTDFYTLIEFYVFYHLREAGLSPQKIISAHGKMAEHLKTPYPFASAEVLTDKKHIFYKLDEEATVQADKTQQIAFSKIIDQFCKKIEFDRSKVAERFYPLGKDRSIVVDPHHQFGQPVISGTNIMADTIYSMYESGENFSTLGILYDLTEAQVADAVAFCERKAA